MNCVNTASFGFQVSSKKKTLVQNSETGEGKNLSNNRDWVSDIFNKYLYHLISAGLEYN